MQLMPRKIREVGAKVIYVARNPKDVAVSYYHLHKDAPSIKFTGDFEVFLKNFTDGFGKPNLNLLSPTHICIVF